MSKDWNQIARFSGKIDNHKLSLGAAEEVTYIVNENGSDSSSSPYTIYFNFSRQAIKTTIRATTACSLVEWNGKVLKSPVSINPGVNVIDAMATRFKIASTASTVIEVTIK